VTLHTAKECLKGFVHAAKDILAATKIRHTQIARSADFSQLSTPSTQAKLFVSSATLTVHPCRVRLDSNDLF
jgi:hypothetical protein